MHTQTLHGHCNVRHNRRGIFSALRLRRRKWWRTRRQAHIARRLALTDGQQDKLDALLSAFTESRERARANVADLFPQFDELLHTDSSNEALAKLLRGGLKTLDGEVEVIAAKASEFLASLDAAQRETIHEALHRRLG